LEEQVLVPELVLLEAVYSALVVLLPELPVLEVSLEALELLADLYMVIKPPLEVLEGSSVEVAKALSSVVTKWQATKPI